MHNQVYFLPQHKATLLHHILSSMNRGEPGVWGGGSYTGLLKMDEGGPLYWGTLRYVKQGSEMGIYFHRGPAFGEHGQAFLSWGLLTRGIFSRSLRDMQLPCRQVSLSTGVPLGNLDGIHLLGLLRKKKQYIWVPFMGPEVIKILSLGAIWNSQ